MSDKITWIFRKLRLKNKYQTIVFILIKLRMEMGNVSKRQQPDHRKNNSRISPTGIQCVYNKKKEIMHLSFENV